MNEKEVKNLIKVWYENKAKMEMDPIFKFLCLWICFNAWLDYQSKKSRDRDMIDWLVTQSPASSDLIRAYESAKQTEPFRRNLEALLKMSPIHDPRERYRSIVIQDLDDRKNIINAIYKIRCNLFHGAKEANNTRDEKLIRCTQKILEKWIGNLVASWKT